ncbi:MAG TPA: DUF6588 family protein [Cyclobacteriaceae bacterium]|nr:DUF6588 family protein [Cyclobacteriaceae bacterium]
MKKNRVLIFLLLTLPFAVAAQDDVNQMLRGTAADAKYLAEGYISPLMKSIGYGMNAGWYNTAKTHSFPGFDLTLSINPAFAPASDKSFTVDNSKLQSVYLKRDLSGNEPSAATGTGNLPTIFGERRSMLLGPKPNPTDASFPAAPGVGLTFFPTPTINLGIGLPKGFDLKVRYVPTLNFGKITKDKLIGEFGLFGIGIMHDFKQYIPGIKALPFDMSVFVGYTSLKFSVGLDKSQPARMAELTSTATTVQALISKKLSVLTGYAGIGYNMATTKFALKGNYSFTDGAKTDPFTTEAKSNGVRATVGLRLKLGPITLHGDYTLQKYNAVSAGFGIAVR